MDKDVAPEKKKNRYFRNILSDYHNFQGLTSTVPSFHRFPRPWKGQVNRAVYGTRTSYEYVKHNSKHNNQTGRKQISVKSTMSQL